MSRVCLGKGCKSITTPNVGKNFSTYDLNFRCNFCVEELDYGDPNKVETAFSNQLIKQIQLKYVDQKLLRKLPIHTWPSRWPNGGG